MCQGQGSGTNLVCTEGQTWTHTLNHTAPDCTFISSCYPHAPTKSVEQAGEDEWSSLPLTDSPGITANIQQIFSLCLTSVILLAEPSPQTKIAPQICSCNPSTEQSLRDRTKNLPGRIWHINCDQLKASRYNTRLRKWNVKPHFSLPSSGQSSVVYSLAKASCSVGHRHARCNAHAAQVQPWFGCSMCYCAGRVWKQLPGIHPPAGTAAQKVILWKNYTFESIWKQISLKPLS